MERSLLVMRQLSAPDHQVRKAKTPDRSIGAQLSEADIRAEVDRVASSPALSRSPQLANFLRFVVEAVISGESDRLKGYTIATGALGRDADFDPQSDPIVRVEAVRLRRALQHYYARTGRNNPLTIVIPRGTYVPVFRPNTTRLTVSDRIHDLGRQISGALRENYRLILLIVAVATILDVLGMLVVNAFRPAARSGSGVPDFAVATEIQSPL